MQPAALARPLLSLLLCCTTLQQPLGREVHAESLDAIEEDFWEWRLRESPEFASSVGVTLYNDRLASYNYTGFDAKRAEVLGFLDRLSSVDVAGLDREGRLDYQIFSDHLETYLDGYPWRFYEPLNPVNFVEGLQTNPAHFIETVPFETSRDYRNYLSRLEKLPHQLEEFISLFTEAIRRGHTSHRVSLEPVPGQIDNLLVEDVTKSTFHLPFNEKLDKSQVPPDQMEEFRNTAKSLVQDVQSAYRRLKNYILNDYIPTTRPQWGVGHWDHGMQNYKACLKWHLSLDMSPEQVHQLGRQEVARIRENMGKTMAKLNFTGSIADFFNMVREEPRFHMSSAEAILQTYNDIVYKEIFPKLSQVFKNIPDLPFKVTPMPHDGVGGEYLAGTADGRRPGIFYVNLHHPRDIATIDMKALALHEAVPGHHMQGMFSLVNQLPAYRKHQEDTNYWQAPFKFPFYTAYLEGWALYAEYLGEEMGIYTDDYELMGRYGSEMFRAARMVVDTGLHYFNWNKEDAVKYMLEHTAYSPHTIDNEINRYITWPGQGCAYKVGELKIKQLRERAETIMGPLFDLADFHALLLQNGPVPLTVMETMVDDWISDVTGSLYK